MSLSLKANQQCPYRNSCPHNTGQFEQCNGASADRKIPFVCDLVSDEGTFIKEGFRNSNDETGKMKILLEDSK